jgi:hypothetical protein
MTVLLRRVEAFAFPSAPPERLAVLRVLVGVFDTLYLAIRSPIFVALADADRTRFRAVGVLSRLTAPVPRWMLVTACVFAVCCGICFVSGAWFRFSGPAFGLALLALCTYRSCWGQILWLENLMVLQTLIVAFSRSADAYRWSPFRAGAKHQADDERLPFRPASEAYGVPVRLAAFVTVATYVLSAIAKLRLSGIGWALSDSLRNHVASSFTRAELLRAPASPLGRWLVSYRWVFPPMAVASLLLELLAPIALGRGRGRDVWVVSIWLMHVSIAALMYVTFPYPLSLIAFAPFFELEHLLPRLRVALRHRGSSTEDAR